MKHIFIINPIAGKKDSKKLIPVIEKQFSSNDDYQIIVTEQIGHATKIASTFKKDDDVCLYAIGGDGTAFEVLNGLNDGVPMAVIPNGTGNDFFRMINYSIDDIEQMLIETINGKTVLVDYGLANERRYLNSSSMGVDADVNELANKIGSKYPIPKSMVYIVASIITIFKAKSINIDMILDGKEVKKNALLIAVMNGKYYGGGFLPTPMADIQDGLLDICVIEDMKFSRIVKVLPKYFKGQHLDIPEVSFYQAKSALLNTPDQVLYGCDGETKYATRIEYKLFEKALPLRVPKGSTLL